MILLADSEGPDQTARMRRLIWAFAVSICPKTCFPIVKPNIDRANLRPQCQLSGYKGHVISVFDQ